MDHRSGLDREAVTRHLEDDLRRVLPLLGRILLIRAVRGIRYNRVHSLWVAKDAIASTSELATAGATTRRLAQALAPTHDVDADLASLVPSVQGLSRALEQKAGAYARYSVRTDPDAGRDPDRIEEAGREWDAARRHASESLERMPVPPGSGTVGSVLLDRALDRVFRRGFLYDLRYYHFAREPERSWQRRAARVVLDAGHAAWKRGRTAVVEDLADDVRTSRRSLDEAQPSEWARQVADRLEQTAVPVLTRRVPPTADEVTAIRLAALCLAHEPEARRSAVLGDALCRVFVGITAFAG
ncbi:hypothetical protein [Saccharothrix stipae]